MLSLRIVMCGVGVKGLICYNLCVSACVFRLEAAEQGLDGYALVLVVCAGSDVMSSILAS